MAVSTSQGAEVQRPLATVVIGGLINRDRVDALFLPMLYPLFLGRERTMGHSGSSEQEEL